MKKRSELGNMLCVYVSICLVFLIITFLGDKTVTVISQNSPIQREHCIIIDAGHGFPDGGTTSVTGVLECNLNLQIAKRTEVLLNLLGLRTFMLRETEESVYTSGNTIGEKKISDILNRVKMANSVDEALLISIHQNYFSDSRYSGAQVFFADSDLSKQFAGEIQGNFVKALQPDNHRLPKEAKGIYLMEHIKCTGVLVECGFLSNPEEDVLISNPEYQKKIAGVLAISAANYLDRSSLD